ncbi:host cell division inhibitor Icd-like protein [Escherichia coli]|nr:host cell division inhibitor Icd-like protein [Escherichia coli]EEY1792913.1 host cell division inhibitor Icd-like protein [Escherichia coli]EEY1829208.1 host cell division inhibitor Icd-like protein [Escherichia coli]EFJ1675913.1 host cell division inhibitor Icd-like protein [Escherichia coli]EFM5183966.1 host cell division inhibitor Icd-like protein [Escherichia coli]
MNITKSAPLPERPCEQLTCCEKNGSVQWNYINRVTKRHNCRITGKTKATRYGGPSTQATRYPQRMSIANNATFAAGGQSVTGKKFRWSYSCSLALRRWRRLISPRMAALINCPVLSPSSFTFSMPSIISWAIRAVTDCDFAFFGPVAMSNSLCFWCKTIYTKKNYFEGLTCKTLLFYIVSYTLLIQGAETTKPGSALTLTGLLTTNDNESIEVAMLNHTIHPQGRDSHNLNKYIWRFIALSTAQPRVITIEATSEQEARQQSPAGCVMVFAARIRQEVRHVQ